MQAFQDIFSQHISSEEKILLAISGWVDSMVMLDLVEKLHPKKNIIIAHFDHSLRWAESEGDRDMVIAVAQKNNISCEVKSVHVSLLADEEKMSIEAVARKYRYEFLFQIAQQYSAKYILTAHHLDDRIETMMFNLIRWSKLWGIHALSRMQNHESLEISIFRPLLSISKQEIIDYAQEHHIEYREDSSNFNTEYLRNKLRHDIVPQFQTINPEYRRAFMNFIEYSEELQDWINDEVLRFLEGTSSFLVKDFQAQKPLFQKEILRYLYAQANHGTIGLSEGNIEEMIRYILTANGQTLKRLWKLMIRKNKGLVIFSSI
jgi:tRNA(Ile)-lysidine synthase